MQDLKLSRSRLLLAEAAGGTEGAGDALDATGPSAAKRAQARIEQATAGSATSEWNRLGCDFWTSRDASGRETGAYPYRYLPYAELVLRMRALAHLYPSLVSLKNAQDDLGVSHTGECSEDLAGVEKAGCRVWYLEVGAHRDDGAIPQVFFSGALHGNERVGPTTLVELVAWLCGHYAQGTPTQHYAGGGGSSGAEDRGDSGSGPTAAGGDAGERGGHDAVGGNAGERSRWAQRLLETRTLVILPAANALGYHIDKREEGRVDPNRDFAFDTRPADCMRTVAARSVNPKP